MIKLINEEKIDSKDKFTLQVLNVPIQCYVDLQIELRKLVMAWIMLTLNEAISVVFWILQAMISTYSLLSNLTIECLILILVVYELLYSQTVLFSFLK